MISNTNAANNYRRLRTLVTLCTTVVNKEDAIDARRQLAATLTRTVSGEFEQYSDLILVTLIEERLAFADSQLTALASGLQSGQLDQTQWNNIEELGMILMQETAKALSRVRSG